MLPSSIPQIKVPPLISFQRADPNLIHWQPTGLQEETRALVQAGGVEARPPSYVSQGRDARAADAGEVGEVVVVRMERVEAVEQVRVPARPIEAGARAPTPVIGNGRDGGFF